MRGISKVVLRVRGIFKFYTSARNFCNFFKSARNFLFFYECACNFFYIKNGRYFYVFVRVRGTLKFFLESVAFLSCSKTLR